MRDDADQVALIKGFDERSSRRSSLERHRVPERGDDQQRRQGIHLMFATKTFN